MVLVVGCRVVLQANCKDGGYRPKRAHRQLVSNASRRRSTTHFGALAFFFVCFSSSMAQLAIPSLGPGAAVLRHIGGARRQDNLHGFWNFPLAFLLELVGLRWPFCVGPLTSRGILLRGEYAFFLAHVVAVGHRCDTQETALIRASATESSDSI
ncbi:hypothetical protein IWX47DRAFT_380369 [Phyllosticta citricarpa]